MNKDQIKKLREVIVEVTRYKLKIEDGTERVADIDSKFDDLRNVVEDLFKSDKNSREYKLFRNWHQGDVSLVYKEIPRPGSPVPRKSKKIDSLENFLRKLLNDPKNNEISFSVDESFQALNYLRKIIKNAQNKIIIIDAYLDDVVFDLIEDIDKDVDIFLLTHNKKKIFNRLFSAFLGGRKRTFARTNNIFHDRYLIIDDKFFYHLGASLNTIGKGDFMINEIEIEDEKNRKIEDFDKWWKSGQEII